MSNFQLDYDAPISSDLSLGVLSIQSSNKFGPKTFNFMKDWMKHSNFKTSLRRVGKNQN